MQLPKLWFLSPLNYSTQRLFHNKYDYINVRLEDNPDGRETS